jgi:AraC family transcriptional regulator
MPSTLRFDARAYACGERQLAHDHGEVHLSIVIRGSVAETVGARTEYAGAMSIVVKDRGVRHANQFGPGGATLARLSLNGGVAELLDDPTRVVEWTWSHNLAAVAPFLRLVGRQSRRAERDIRADDPDVVDLLAALSARREDRRRGEPPRWLVEALAWVRAEWHPAMSVSDVASRAQVHPVYLARCVRRWYGHSVGDELRRLRLASAAQRVAGHTDGLSQVALDAGYADQAHLCRDFRRATGVTPGSYRATVHQLVTLSSRAKRGI